MRTVIVSDLHLGNGGGFDTFAGGEALPAFLDRYVSPPSRVILNGDSVDFLMNEDPLELETERAVAQARAIAKEPSTQAVFGALGRVLAGGGEAIIRLGNHDIEVALPEVQEVLREALGQPRDIAQKLVFQSGDAPGILEIGGARVLVTHGEHNDPWNRVDYPALAKRSDYTYSPGSLLVKQLMNPLKRAYGMRFADLLKPDFQGAVLTALAVAPSAMKLLLQKASIRIVWQLFRKKDELPTFPEDDLGLAERIGAAGLTEEEEAVLDGLLGDGPVPFSEEDEALLSSATMKLARKGLETYARFQRSVTGTTGETYFELTPDKVEWEDAKRLAKKFNARAVLIGHTHAARWRDEEGVAFANTGTWIWLMQLPPADAPAEEWVKFLDELKKNPGLSKDKPIPGKLYARFTAAVVEPLPEGGAELSLVEWDQPSGTMRSLGSSRISAG